jgi:hypothetical protein
MYKNFLLSESRHSAPDMAVIKLSRKMPFLAYLTLSIRSMRAYNKKDYTVLGNKFSLRLVQYVRNNLLRHTAASTDYARNILLWRIHVVFVHKCANTVY